MRLLVVTQYFWPENFRINDLVGELVRRGHHVTVLTGKPNYPEGKPFPEFVTDPNRFSRYEGADVVRVPMMARGSGSLRLLLNFISFAVSAACLGAWKLRTNTFDAVVAYEPSPITVGLPAAMMRYLKHAPLVFWVQDLWPETLRDVGVIRSKRMLWAVGRLVAFIYKRCDLILAQSKSFVPQIRKYAPAQTPVLYFPNWSDATCAHEESEPAKEVPIKSGSFNVMFAGNIGDAQDFPSILAAAECLKAYSNIRWLIVGDGRLAAWVTEEVNRRQLQDQVLMLGRYPSERMSSFFKHADALLVSLKNEPIFSMTIPSKLQTYLSVGIPVLTMLNGEGSELVRESESGFTCNAGDYEGLAASILALSSMSIDERKKIGSNGMAVSNHEFNREKLITQLEVWTESLIHSKKKIPTEPIDK